MSELNYHEILSIIKAHGFRIVSELKTNLNDELIDKFYGEHIGKSFYPSLSSYMRSGPVVALHLRKTGAVKGWRYLIGPTNITKAKDERPYSIRALFGLDGTRNAVHGSDSRVSAAREVAFFFSFGRVVSENSTDSTSDISTVNEQILTTEEEPTPIKSLRPQPLLSLNDKKVMLNYLQKDINQQLTGFISRALIDKPEDFYDFAVKDWTEQQKKQPTITVPSGRSPQKKLEPLKSKSEPKFLFEDNVSKSLQISESEPSIQPTATDQSSSHQVRYNRTVESFNELENAKLEILSLKKSISSISSNLRNL